MKTKFFLAFALIIFGVGFWMAAASGNAPRSDRNQLDGRPRPGLMTITEPKPPASFWMADFDAPYFVRWTKVGIVPGEVKIDLCDAACVKVVKTLARRAPNSGNYRVGIGPNVSPGLYTVRLTALNSPIVACSEAFKIVPLAWKLTLPPGPWVNGHAYTVTWTTTEPANIRVNLFFLQYSSIDDRLILGSSLNDGSETFTISAAPGTYPFVLIPANGLYGGKTFYGGLVTVVR